MFSVGKRFGCGASNESENTEPRLCIVLFTNNLLGARLSEKVEHSQFRRRGVILDSIGPKVCETCARAKHAQCNKLSAGSHVGRASVIADVSQVAFQGRDEHVYASFAVHCNFGLSHTPGRV